MNYKKLSLTFLLITSLTIVFAQDPPPVEPPPGEGEDVGGPQGGGVPVDAGLSFLLASGVAYGAKKAYDYRKNKVKSEK